MPDLATKCVYINQGIDEKTGAVNPPIYQTAGFSYPNPDDLENVFNGKDFGFTYSRISNPTIAELERRVAYLDSGLGAVALSSGLAAIFSLGLVLCEKGQNIVVSNALFGGTRDLFEETFPKLAVDIRFCDVVDEANVRSAVDDNTAFIFTEIISNPKLTVPNLSILSNVAKTASIPLIVDATLTGSVGFNAKSHGVDLILYSSTKLFATNGGAIGGVIVDTGNFNWRESKQREILTASKQVHRFAFLERLRRHALHNAGFCNAPMNAYLTMLGLETLSIRYSKICENALAIAQFFESEVVSVNYPGLASHPNHEDAKRMFDGFGPLLTIDLGTKERAFAFISKLKIVQNMSNLGDNRTMVIHPKSTIYSKHSDEQLLQAGVTDGLIRINVGIESVHDLTLEFREALQ